MSLVFEQLQIITVVENVFKVPNRIYLVEFVKSLLDVKNIT